MTIHYCLLLMSAVIFTLQVTYLTIYLIHSLQSIIHILQYGLLLLNLLPIEKLFSTTSVNLRSLFYKGTLVRVVVLVINIAFFIVVN